jgi:acyl transferase domain-containing protein
VSGRGERVAIVGLGGLFPGAADLDGFWENVARGVDCSREVPPGRWRVPPERAFDPRLARPDRVVSTRGYFLDSFTPDLAGLDIDPALVEELDVLFHVALTAGGRAFRSAQMASVDRARAGVILGSIALPTDRVSELAREVVAGGTSSVNPLNRHVTGLPAVLLARALGLGGTAFTLDAACASSLYAVKLAADELLAGRADAMLAGGLSRPDCLYTQTGFSQLRALSPSGRCSPFDAAADGLVVGEGGGVFVLKRLADALAHGDTIHGVIAGVALSNDVEGNLLAPAEEGQLRALRTAYRGAGWRPADVDLVECHATGTPVGDAVEFRSMMELWRGEAGRCVIGSVKATVGHLLTGAGAAGLTKVLLALRHGTLPPSANFHEAAPGVALAGSPFRVLNRAEPWERRGPGIPRRASVSGFGFGGINAHLLIEEWLGEDTLVGSRRAAPSVPVAVVGLAAHFGDAKGNAQFAARALGAEGGSCRVDEVEVPAGAFAIPPKEMEEMLPQQTLLLEVAARAATPQAAGETTGVFVGVALDLNTTNFSLRWAAGEEAHDDSAAAMDAASPPLTADRTMGALASIAASRVARALRTGGPSFTISSGDLSGIHALKVAADLLAADEIDRALVGAVDLNDDPRATWVDGALRGEGIRTGDGAVALVLKRLDDARRDGDHVLAIFGEGSEPLYREGSGESVVPTADVFGHCGAAVGLAAIARACLALNEKTLPPRRDAKSQYWLHDRERGPRSAEVRVAGLLGAAETVALREDEERIEPRVTVLPRPCGLFLVAGDTRAEFAGRLERLQALAEGEENIDALARRWWRETRSQGRGAERVALVARDVRELIGVIAEARGRTAGPPAKLAFVLPPRTRPAAGREPPAARAVRCRRDVERRPVGRAAPAHGAVRAGVLRHARHRPLALLRRRTPDRHRLQPRGVGRTLRDARLARPRPDAPSAGGVVALRQRPGRAVRRRPRLLGLARGSGNRLGDRRAGGPGRARA